MLPVEQLASAAKIERIDINKIQYRRLQKTARTPWSSSSRAGWSSAGQPGLPEMLAVENTALHEFFESGLRSWRPSSSRSAASDDARRAQRRAHHVRRDATEVGALHWPSAAKVLPMCIHTCTILPGPERLPGCRIWVCRIWVCRIWAAGLTGLLCVCVAACRCPSFGMAVASVH